MALSDGGMMQFRRLDSGTHSGRPGNTEHCRANGWAGMRLVRAPGSFPGPSVRRRSQRHVVLREGQKTRRPMCVSVVVVVAGPFGLSSSRLHQGSISVQARRQGGLSVAGGPVGGESDQVGRFGFKTRKAKTGKSKLAPEDHIGRGGRAVKVFEYRWAHSSTRYEGALPHTSQA